MAKIGLHECDQLEEAIAAILPGVTVELKPWKNEMIVFENGERICSGNLDFTDVPLDLLLANTKELLEIGRMGH